MCPRRKRTRCPSCNEVCVTERGQPTPRKDVEKVEGTRRSNPEDVDRIEYSRSKIFREGLKSETVDLYMGVDRGVHLVGGVTNRGQQCNQFKSQPDQSFI